MSGPVSSTACARPPKVDASFHPAHGKPVHGAASPPVGCKAADGHSGCGIVLQPAAAGHTEDGGPARRDAATLPQKPGEHRLHQLPVSQQAAQPRPGSSTFCSYNTKLTRRDKQVLGARETPSQPTTASWVVHDMLAIVSSLTGVFRATQHPARPVRSCLALMVISFLAWETPLYMFGVDFLRFHKLIIDPCGNSRSTQPTHCQSCGWLCIAGFAQPYSPLSAKTLFSSWNSSSSSSSP
jgi:hypothetical protein